jgi:HEAT repeat protein
VAAFLRETLESGRYRVGAAGALAALGDPAATATLAEQLELNAMRVSAARALRRLGAEVSLEPLALALTHDDEVSRLTAAEAILILTGPRERSLSKRQGD